MNNKKSQFAKETIEEIDKVMDLFGYTPKEKEKFGLINKWLVERMQQKDGATCPLCKRKVKLYRRTIHSNMARALLSIYRYYKTHDKNKSMHVEGYFKRVKTSCSTRGDISKLQYWDLLQKNSDKKGHYYLTREGEEFVERKRKVKKFAFCYNKKQWGELQGPEISIQDALTEEFNLEKILSEPVEDFEGSKIA